MIPGVGALHGRRCQCTDQVSCRFLACVGKMPALRELNLRRLLHGLWNVLYASCNTITGEEVDLFLR